MDLECRTREEELTMLTWCQRFRRSSRDIKRAYAIKLFILLQKATPRVCKFLCPVRGF